MARELNPSRNGYDAVHPSSVRKGPLAQTALLQHKGPLQPIGLPEQAKASFDSEKDRKGAVKGAAQAARDAERLALRARLEELQREDAYGNDSDDFEEEENEKENEEKEDEEDEEEMAPEDRPPRPSSLRPRRKEGEGTNVSQSRS